MSSTKEMIEEASGRLSQVAEKYESIKHEEMLEMLASLFDKMDEIVNCDSEEDARRCLEFSGRMLGRANAINDVQNLNIVWEESTKDAYNISNYSYDTFIWAINNGFDKYISNNVIRIPEKGLDERLKRYLESKKI